MSHQWLGDRHPDSSGVQYRVMVHAAEALAEKFGVPASELFIFIDNSSIPQRNSKVQQNAIDTLCSYASLASAFVVIAPISVHGDTKLMCDFATYSKRMWCRCELFAKLVCGADHVYLASTQMLLDDPKLRQLIRFDLHSGDSQQLRRDKRTKRGGGGPDEPRSSEASAGESDGIARTGGSAGGDMADAARSVSNSATLDEMLMLYHNAELTCCARNHEVGGFPIPSLGALIVPLIVVQRRLSYNFTTR